MVPATRLTTPIWLAKYHMNRRISTEVHEDNLLRAHSRALADGALNEAGAARS